MASVLMETNTSSPSLDKMGFTGNMITDRKHGDNGLSAKFIKELECVYNKADMHEKAKCLELITSAKLGEDLKRHVKKLQRPKTAMPALNYPSELNSHQTSYERDYTPKTGRELWALRPMTSLGHGTSVSESKQPGLTVYDIEYCRKFQRPASPERSGTSSGQRNNKPHPPQSFLVWKFPSKTRYNLTQDDGTRLLEDVTNEKLRQITRRLCHSVYQNDYLGIPQGFQVSSAFNTPSNWKDNVPYGMNSIQREAYQLPHQQQNLTISTTRYGSNTQKQTPAIAAIPTANKRQVDVHQRTTYDSHFNDNAGPVIEQIRNAGKSGAETLQKYAMIISRQEKDQANTFLPKREGRHHSRSHLHEEATYSIPPLSAESILPLEKVSPTTQRHELTTPLEKGCACVSTMHQHPSASYMAQTVCSANKSRSSVPPATAIVLSPKLTCQMPTTPSVVYPPPLFLS